MKRLFFISLLFVASIITAQPDWTYKATSTNHVIGITKASNPNVDGEKLEVGDYIGVFFKRDGKLVCGGYIVWKGNKNMSLTVWGNDTQSDIKDGFDFGEEFNWKFWIKRSNRIYTGQVEFLTGPTTFAINGISVLKKTENKRPDWDPMVSHNKHTIKVPKDVIFEFEDTELSFGDYIGVFYDSAGTDKCAGKKMWDANYDVEITAYGDSESTEEVEGFKIGEGFKWKLWRSLDNFTMDAEAEYRSGPSVFTIDGKTVLGKLSYIGDSGPGWVFTKTNQSHIIGIPIFAKPRIETEQLKSGDYIGVFFLDDNKEKCAGFSVWKENSSSVVTAWGDDAQTIKKEGFVSNEKFIWKIWSKASQKAYSALATYDTSQPNDSLFVANGISALTSLIGKESDEPVDTNEYIYLTAYIRFREYQHTKDYKIIGLPGNDKIPLENHVIGDWVSFWDDGNDIYVPFTEKNREIFNLATGRGFWLLSTKAFKVDSLKVIKAKPQKGVYRLALHEGWNIISTPFAKSLNWESVLLQNNITDRIHHYSRGSFKNGVTSFDPFIGYYFYNRDDLKYLEIPENDIPNNKKNNATEEPIFEASLIKEKEITSQIKISFNENSDVGLDRLDQFAPPATFEENKIYIYNQNFKNRYKILSEEVRPLNKEGENVFTVFVKSGPKTKTTLSFSLPKNNLECFLLDINRLKIYNLKEDSLITVTQLNEFDEYKVIMGTKEYIEKNPLPKLPTQSKVYQNYPNPFNPATKLKFYLKNTSRVKIFIHNTLGEQMTMLDESIKEAGLHEVRWNAGNLPSGIYFYTVTATSVNGNNTFRETKKMILLK